MTIGQVHVARVIAVDRKVIEVAGHLYVEPPKNRKQRRTIYPRTTPLADPLEARTQAARCAAHDPGYRPGGVCLLAVPAGPAAGGGGVAVSWTTHSPLSLDWDRYGTCTGTQQARRRSPIPRGPTAQAVSLRVPLAHGCRRWDGPHR